MLNALFTIAPERRYTGRMAIAAALLAIAATTGGSSPLRVHVEATATVRILAGERVHFPRDHHARAEQRDDLRLKWRDTQLMLDGRSVPATLLEFE